MGTGLTIAHTWRAALPGQTCQGCRNHARRLDEAWPFAVWALVIEGSGSGEELLCEACANFNVHRYGLSAPPTIFTAGADASAQTSEADAGTNSVGLSTNHRSNL